VLINGLKLSDPQTGHHQFNLPLTSDAIQQIDINKTSASRLYGINALTGAVNFITKVPDSNQIYFGSFEGSYGLYGIQTGAAIHVKNVGTHLAYSRSVSNGYTNNTDFNINNLFYQTSVKGKKSDFTIFGGYTDRRFGARGFYVPNSTEFESIQTAFGGTSYQLKIGQLTLKAQGYYRYNQDHYIYIRSNPSIYQNRHFSHTAGAELHATYTSVLGETGIGFDARHEELNSNNLGQRQRDILGAFVEHRMKLMHKKLTITPGLYTNKIGDNFSFFPGIDAGYTVNKYFMLFAGSSKAMRLPTYTDLYYRGPSNIGNANLKPEEAISTEGGVKFWDKNLFASIAAFNRTSTNLIDWAKNGSSTTWQPLNVNHVTFNGVETNIQASFKTILQQIRVGYTYINANINQTENYLSRYALSNIRHHVTAVVNLKYHKNITHSITVRHVNRELLADYTLFDSKLAYKFDAFNFYVDLSNIFNAKYTEAGYVTMPGRWLKIGFDYKLQ
jgi:vitamin B12 transporter